MRIDVHRHVDVRTTYRTSRALALFNIVPADVTDFHISADVPVERDDWQIGAIVGPSGSGKSTLLSAVLEHEYVDPTREPWPADMSILDALEGGFEEVTGLLASVGLGTVPSWIRPYHVLSNGERFRADLARALGRRRAQPRMILDEFTSVVDRRVATIGAGAFAKAWRRGPGQVIVVGPHFDILPWMEPDWVIRTSTTGPTVSAQWDALAPEVVRDPASPTVAEVLS